MPDPFSGVSIAGLTSTAPGGPDYISVVGHPFLAWDPSISAPVVPAHDDGSLGTPANPAVSCGPCPGVFPFPQSRTPAYGGLTRDVDVYSEFGYGSGGVFQPVGGFPTPPDFVVFFVHATVGDNFFKPEDKVICSGCFEVHEFDCSMGWQLTTGIGGDASVSITNTSGGDPIDLWMQRPIPISYDGDPTNPDLVYLYHYTEFAHLQQFVAGVFGQAGIEENAPEVHTRIFPLWREVPATPPDSLMMVI